MFDLPLPRRYAEERAGQATPKPVTSRRQAMSMGDARVLPWYSLRILFVFSWCFLRILLVFSYCFSPVSLAATPSRTVVLTALVWPVFKQHGVLPSMRRGRTLRLRPERDCPQPQQHRPRNAARVFRPPTPCGRAAAGDRRAPAKSPRLRTVAVRGYANPPAVRAFGLCIQSSLA